MSRLHEIPTHLEVSDGAVLGLTMRQLLTAAVGLSLALGAATDLPFPPPLRAAAASALVALTALMVLWRPSGRPLEDWSVVLLRYSLAPRVSTWRPRARRAGAAELREVVLPPVRRRGAGRDGGTRGDAA